MITELPAARELPDDVRRQMRAALLEEAAGDRTARRRRARWLAPTAAAACAATVVGAVWVAGDRASRDLPGPDDRSPGAASSSAGQELRRERTPVSEQCAALAQGWHPAGRLRSSLETRLTTAWYFRGGGTWSICLQRGFMSVPTLYTPDSVANDYVPEWYQSLNGSGAGQFVKVGPTPRGVRALTFHFTDGRSVKAQVGPDFYLLAVRSRGSRPAPPTSVTLTYADGSSRERVVDMSVGGPVTMPFTEPPQSCELTAEELLPGARQADAVPIADTTVRLFTAGAQAAICDDWAAGDGGPPTWFAPRPQGGPADRESFRVGLSLREVAGTIRPEYVAGGPAIPGVRSIVYTFPGGDSVPAVLTDQMWAMAYFPTDGPMADDRMPEGELTTIEVTYDNADVATFQLVVGPGDFCAQVNHGC